MKQLLFLLLFPCLALAQYTGNGNQKITLGEQSTADGLVFRGLAADTTRKPSVDTMAYILLDTNTNIIWQYKKAINNAWLKVNLTQADTTLFNYVNTYGTQTVNGAKTFNSAVTGARFNPTSTSVTGTGMFLPSANTIGLSTNSVNQQTLHPNGITIFKPTPQNLSTTFRLIEIGAQGSIYSAPGAAGRFNDYTFGLGYYWDVPGNARYMNTETILTHQPIRLTLYQGSFSIDNSVVGTKDSIITFTRLLTLNELGKLGIGTSEPSDKLHVVGNARITAVGAGTFANNLNITSDGTLTTATSDEKYKYNILPINYGLNTILQLKPVNFQWIKGEENDLGFIAQDVADIIPEAVDTNWNSDLLMRYESIIPILTKAIQEQNLLIKALEQRILILENK